MSGLKKNTSLFDKIIPPQQWRTPVIILLGCIVGIGFYVLKLSNAVSYLSDDPQACINCHVMTPQYLTWTHSSHREIATCNDCHVPHNNIVNKYFFKAKDGLYHSSVFTLRREPEVIKALNPSINVIQNNCVRCHHDQVTDAKLEAFVAGHHENRTDRLCWDCHREVPHGRVKSLSSAGHMIESLRASTSEKHSVVPDWLKQQLETKLENN